MRCYVIHAGKSSGPFVIAEYPDEDLAREAALGFPAGAMAMSETDAAASELFRPLIMAWRDRDDRRYAAWSAEWQAEDVLSDAALDVEIEQLPPDERSLEAIGEAMDRATERWSD